MSDLGRRSVTGLALLALSATLSGCLPQGLAFKVDERLTFISPEERSTVGLPVTVDWEMRDFEVTPPGTGEPRKDAGYFAVFVDTPPMPPGKNVRWLARKDNSCRPTDGCPDAEYLTARGIYTTTETELVLEQLPRTTRADRQERRERHRVTVVLLDSGGRRIGESAFEITFDIDRQAQR